MNHRPWRAVGAVLSVLSAFLACPAGLSAQEVPTRAAAEEAFFVARFGGVAETYLTVLYHDGEIFLPLAELFAFLAIEYQFEPAARRGSGFYADPDVPYTIDASSRRITIGTREVPLQPAEMIADSTGILLRSDVLERAFGLEVDVDLGALVLDLNSELTLPIVRRMRREQMRTRRGDAATTAAPHAPLLFPRRRRLVEGATGGYHLSLAGSGSGVTPTVGLSGGMQVLGGDLQMFSNTAWTTLGWDGSAEVRWQYVAPEHAPWFTQLQAGGIAASRALHPLPFNGISISNAPIEPLVSAGRFTISGSVEADWEVELYLNDRLVDFTVADANGDYRFAIALPYGTSIVRTRAYGPTGGSIEERQALQVPFTLLPPGHTEYHLSAGRRLHTGDPLVQFRLSRGLSTRLTATIGAEHVDDATGARSVGYAAAAWRLFGNTVLGADLAPGVLRGLNITAILPSFAEYSLEMRSYESGGAYNPAGLDWSWSARTFTPFSARGLPFVLRTSGNGSYYRSGNAFQRADADLTLTQRRIKPRLLLQWQESGRAPNRITTTRIGSGLQYYVGTTSDIPRLVRGGLLNGTVTWDLEAREQPIGGRIDFSRNAFGGRISVALSQDHRQSEPRFDIRFLRQTGHGVYQASMLGSASHTAGALSLDGGFAVDPRARRIIPAERSAVGRGSVAFSFYLDANGNRQQDPDEADLVGPTIQFRQATPLHDDGAGTIRATDLIPYHRYSVTADPATIANPLWVPTAREFSFIAEPNVVRHIRIPFVAAGLIAGTVTEALATGSRGRGGVILHVTGPTLPEPLELVTYSDGSFYFLGIPPGEYEISVTRNSLVALRAAAQPDRLRFTVPALLEGASVENLDFVLIRE